MDSVANFRSSAFNEPRIFGGSQLPTGRAPINTVLNNGTIQAQRYAPATTTNTAIPPLPPKPYSTAQQSMFSSPGMGMYNSYGGGGMYSNMMGYGSGYGMNPYSRYGGSYGSMYGGMYGGIYGQNPYQMRDPMDPESRFIQLAEESSRPAFQSIQTVVMAIGNIASMIHSTFDALYGSFHAILGVAANFGQLRGVFAQFFSTFALIRHISWLYKKLLYMIGIRKENPASVHFNEAFAAAAGIQGSPNAPRPSASAWPILTFLGLIFATPYLIMKLIGQVSLTAIEESRNPQTWVQPCAAEAMYTYNKTDRNELSLYPGLRLQLAPREVQQTQKLLNTGWALATIDGRTSGLIPINYIRRFDARTPMKNPEATETPMPEPIPEKMPMPMSTPIVGDAKPINEVIIPTNWNETNIPIEKPTELPAPNLENEIGVNFNQHIQTMHANEL